MGRTYYPAIIEEVYSSYVKARVQVGKVELTLNFPLKAMQHHNLINVGDRFNYHPSKDNSLRRRNIKPIKEEPIDEKKLREGLRRLCNPEDGEGLNAKLD